MKTISQYIEKGKRRASIVFLKNVCFILNIDEDEMFTAVIADFVDKLTKEWEDES